MKQISLKKNLWMIFISLLFGCSCAIGYIVKYDRTLPTIISVAILDGLFFYVLIFCLLRVFNSRILISNHIISENNCIIRFFEQRTWLKIFICLLILWIPFIIARYPGIQSGGVIIQFQQFMGMNTKARQLSPIIYEGHYITAHHPVLLTYVFGLFIKIGIALGHPNLGMFLLACLICCLNALGWSFVLFSIKKYIDCRVWTILLLFFGLNPMIISLNTYVLKDNLFATALAVYSILIFRFFHEKNNDKKTMMSLLVTSIILPFVKNQGIYIVILTTVIPILFVRRKRKYWLYCLILPILCFNVLFQGILMPTLKIAPGGKQEMLSIFCQTTARTINEHTEVMNSEDYEAIYTILPVDDWTVYKSTSADAIKSHFNQDSSTDDLINYFKVWIREGLQYPSSYLNAIFAQTYGYYYIDSITSDWIWGGQMS